jgi:hypothetical protein
MQGYNREGDSTMLQLVLIVLGAIVAVMGLKTLASGQFNGSGHWEPDHLAGQPAPSVI